MPTFAFNAVVRSMLVVLTVVMGDALRCGASEPSTREPGDARRPGSSAARRNAQAASERWGTAQIVVYKSKRILALYRGGRFEKEFPIVLGLQPQGRKRHAHDARTPEGLYHVVHKHPHRRWQWFLAIDYPNPADRKAYGADVEAGKIPDENGAPFAIGSEVGIHGNDRATVQEEGVDWTKGCIAMKAVDVKELAAAVPVGTPVWIVE